MKIVDILHNNWFFELIHAKLRKYSRKSEDLGNLKDLVLWPQIL